MRIPNQSIGQIRSNPAIEKTAVSGGVQPSGPGLGRLCNEICRSPGGGGVCPLCEFLSLVPGF